VTRLLSAALGLLALLAIGPGLAGRDEVTLFDEPRGAWLGTVRAGARLEILEERDGWRRVRVEGWLPSPVGASPVPGSASGAPASPEPAPPPGSGAAVRGTLLPVGPSAAGGAGAGLVVLLVGRLDGLDAEHALLGTTCGGQARAARERAASLRAEADRALTQVDNYRQAMNRHDRLDREAAEAEREGRDLLHTCRERAMALFESHALMKTISDVAGRFEFRDVPPGRYRVVAAETAGDRPRSWSLECPVSGPGQRVLDPRTDASRVPPFWDL
jgi:hypothetical protein